MAEANKSPNDVPRTIAGAPKQLTPLWIVALFLTFTETVCGVAVTLTAGFVQISLTCFVILFPMLVAGAFFTILWKKPWQLYSPHDFTQVEVEKFVKALRGVEKARGKIEKASSQVDRLMQLMAETRILELEVIQGRYMQALDPKQREMLSAQLEELRKLTARKPA